jgi:putative peptide zinc metalloprotease protein
MDGDHTVRDIVTAYYAKYRSIGLEEVLQVMLQFEAANFVEIQGIRNRRRQGSDRRAARRFELVPRSLVVHYFSLPDVDRGVAAIYRRFFWLMYTRPALIAELLVIIGGSLLFTSLVLTSRLPNAPPGILATIAVVSLLGVAIHLVLHEASHALTCKHFGREVHSAGVGWYFFMPVAFVDTSDIWMAPRWPRIAVASAGPIANVLLSSSAALAIPMVDPVTAVALANFALFGFALAIVNMNPLMEFDGYYVLMDCLDVPNLRQKAMAFVGSVAWKSPRPVHDRRTARIFVVYGILSLAYTILVAWSILTGYHRYLEAAVSQYLPGMLPTLLGWSASLAMAGLIVSTAWAELRPRRTGDA